MALFGLFLPLFARGECLPFGLAATILCPIPNQLFMPKHPYNRGKDAPDPQLFILVKSKDGWHYRRRRRTTTLNDCLQASADGLKPCGAAAKRLRDLLREVFRGLDVGRAQARLSAGLKKALLQKGQLDFSFLNGFDFQKYSPMEDLLTVPWSVETKTGKVRVRMVLDAKAVNQKNGLVSHYYFDLVLVWGDAGRDENLRLDTVTSPLYAFAKDNGCCELSLPLPATGEPWMLLLKISCLEGNELAHHPRHYGLRVVATGSHRS